jgi:N-acetylneuraminate synthase/N,N'-diacetyllegionaminate synthase
VDFLDRLGVPAFKVPSGEMVNLPLLRHIAKKNKPVFLSTGMSYLSEVETAVGTFQAGRVPLVVLHCVSNYPTAPSDANLRAMGTMSQALGLPVGFSDHTLGIEVTLAAVALGACVIEKHFTLDRTMAGPDHRASLEPDELRAMVQGIRTVEAALGGGVKEPMQSEENTRKVARRSIYLWRDASEGAILREQDLIALRPSGGIPPDRFDEVVGKRLQRSLTAGTALSWDDLK